MLLFKVRDTFAISGKGLIISAESISDDVKVLIGDKIQIITPDDKVIETTIKGITLKGYFDLLIDQNVAREDIPIGSEVWLNKE